MARNRGRSLSPEDPQAALERWGLGVPAAPTDRIVTMGDLPPAVAGRISFDRAAPRRLRGDKLPDDVREAMGGIWDEIIPEIYDELAGHPRRDLFKRDTIERVLRRVSGRVLAAEGRVIELGVRNPVRFEKDWKHTATVSAGAGGVAVAEEIAAYGSAGTAASVSVAAIVVGELLETYVAASARTVQYLRSQRSPDVDMVVADLAESTGYTGVAGRRAGRELTREAATWLASNVLQRVARRFLRGLMPVVGVVTNATMAGMDLRKVTRLPLRPMAEDEMTRLHQGLHLSRQPGPPPFDGIEGRGSTP